MSSGKNCKKKELNHSDGYNYCTEQETQFQPETISNGQIANSRKSYKALEISFEGLCTFQNYTFIGRL